MKNSATILAFAAVSLLSSAPLTAQVADATSNVDAKMMPTDPSKVGQSTTAPGDRDWQALIEARGKVGTGGSPAGQEEGRAARTTGNRSVAEQARRFYVANAQDPRAAEARKIEIFSLIGAVEDGDEGSNRRLEQAVAALRSDAKVPASVRARGVAAFEFTRGLREVRSFNERLEATALIARDLIKEFPAEPPAYEALWAVAKALPLDQSKELAGELIASDAPVELKTAAQVLVERYELIGRTLSSVLGENAAKLTEELPTETQLIVYSWATWAPGSLEFGRMVQGRRFAALGICLDENIEEAGKAAHSLGLGGRHIYDKKGLQGELAGRLKFSTAGQIYLVDEKGLIRDVRGGEDFEDKIASLGFQSPVINPPSTAELLRQ